MPVPWLVETAIAGAQAATSNSAVPLAEKARSLANDRWVARENAK